MASALPHEHAVHRENAAPPQHVLHHPTLEGLAEYIRRKDVRRILVMMGAGVSVAAGIPDFRSPNSGLYANLGKYDLDSPTDAFSLPLLRQRPSVFYDIAHEMDLWPGRFQPTPVHHFIRLLADEGRLLRCCTQNIDGLEREAGVPESLLVEAHGSFRGARCIDCGKDVPIEEVYATARNKEIPHCTECGGIVKPNVVFFGENLPESFFHAFSEDTEKAELLLVIGTSLQVHPFAALAMRVRSTIPRVLINLERVGGDMFRFPQDNNALGKDEGDSEWEGGTGGDSAVPSPAPHADLTSEVEDEKDSMKNPSEGHHKSKDADESGDYDSQRSGSNSTSSSEGFSQYVGGGGGYGNHPPVCRDLFLGGDCQETIQELADLMGFGEALAVAIQKSQRCNDSPV